MWGYTHPSPVASDMTAETNSLPAMFLCSDISGALVDSGVFYLIGSVCGWWLQEVTWRSEINKSMRRTLKYF